MRPSRRDGAEALRARREALRARLRRRPAGRSRRRPWGLLLLLALALLLAALCCCASPPPEVVAPPAPAPAPTVPTPPAPPPPAPLTGRVERRDRPSFRTPASEGLPWLAAFQLQVSARSPRLAGCFVGAARPGTLKWTAEVEPVSGRVSDHTLEPTLQSDPLTPDQRACVLDVLSQPPYRLEADARATPSRVGIAIEF